MSLPRFRLLLVTFDLTDTRRGDARYRLADQALANYGRSFRPVKQIRLLLTRMSAETIKASLQQRIGRSETVLIVDVTSIPAWRISRAKQTEWRRFVEAVEEAGIDVRGLARSVES